MRWSTWRQNLAKDCSGERVGYFQRKSKQTKKAVGQKVSCATTNTPVMTEVLVMNKEKCELPDPRAFVCTGATHVVLLLLVRIPLPIEQKCAKLIVKRGAERVTGAVGSVSPLESHRST